MTEYNAPTALSGWVKQKNIERNLYRSSMEASFLHRLESCKNRTMFSTFYNFLEIGPFGDRLLFTMLADEHPFTNPQTWTSIRYPLSATNLFLSILPIFPWLLVGKSWKWKVFPLSLVTFGTISPSPSAILISLENSFATSVDWQLWLQIGPSVYSWTSWWSAMTASLLLIPQYYVLDRETFHFSPPHRTGSLQ